MILVCTDVQGSTALWEAEPGPMAEALALHEDSARALWEDLGGEERAAAGDSFTLAFADAESAATFAVELQHRLLDVPWPPALLGRPEAAETRGPFRGLRVRVGLRSGHDEAAVEAVCDAAHGGQVLAPRDLVDDLEGDALVGLAAGIRRAGSWHLPHHEGPVELVELRVQGLEGRRFPAPRAESARRSNLPEPNGSLLGRESLVGHVVERVRAGVGAILLRGPAGAGKSRLAAEIARHLHDAQAMQAWRVDCSDISTLAGLVHAVATTVGLSMAPGADTSESVENLVASLGGRRDVVLVLDGADRCLPAVDALTGAWADSAVRVLSTSRQSGATRRAETVEVPPLDGDAAVALYRQLVGRMHAGAPLQGVTDAQIEALVDRLDRLPLALELAAARAGEVDVSAVTETFAALVEQDGPLADDALDRAVRWSWDLLDAASQSACCALASFRGGFDLDAAAAVLGLDVLTAADQLEGLRTHSLLRLEPDPSRPGEPRFALYSAVRRLALALGPSRDPEGAAAGRHAAWYLDFAQVQGRALHTGARAGAGALLAVELGNLLAAFDRVPDANAADLVLALDPYLLDCGPVEVHARLLDEGLARALESQRGGLLLRRARARFRRGQPDAAREDLADPCLSASPLLRARREQELGNLAVETGNLPEAAQRLGAAAPLLEAAGASDEAASARANEAIAHAHQGRFPQAEACFRQALSSARRRGDEPLQARVLTNLGTLAMIAGDGAAVEEHLRRAIRLNVGLGERRAEALGRLSLGTWMRQSGAPESALPELRRAEHLLSGLGDRRGAAGASAHLGCVAMDAGDLEQGHARLRAVDALYESIGEVRLRAAFLPFLGAARAQTGDLRGAEDAFVLATQLARSIEAPEPEKAAALLRGLLDPDEAPALLASVPATASIDVTLAALSLRAALVRAMAASPVPSPSAAHQGQQEQQREE